jgi:hypothetical protein
MRSSPARGWWLPEAGIVSGLGELLWSAVKRASQLLRQMKKRLIMLHQTLGAVDARRRRPLQRNEE